MTMQEKWDALMAEQKKRIRRQHIRRTIVGGLLGGALGLVLGISGLDWATWQFWAVSAIHIGIIWNTVW